jgi:alpha-L-fucosidase
VNGEAIYGSRPWLLYGEGPTKVTSSAKDTDNQAYTSEDIRYTTRNGVLYAIALGWPESRELRLHSLWRGTPYLSGPVCSVQLLGSSEKLAWTQREDGLHIQLPQTKPDEPAFVFRILESNRPSDNCGG